MAARRGQTATSTGSTSLGLSSFVAISENKAFAACYQQTLGSAGGIWKSEYGGATWTQIPDLYQTHGVSFPNAIHFSSALNGTIAGDPQNGYFEIYNTTDGGDTWHSIFPTNDNLLTTRNTFIGYIPESTGSYFATGSDYDWDTPGRLLARRPTPGMT